MNKLSTYKVHFFLSFLFFPFRCPASIQPIASSIEQTDKKAQSQKKSWFPNTCLNPLRSIHGFDVANRIALSTWGGNCL